MKHIISLLLAVTLVLTAPLAGLHAQNSGKEYLRTNPKFLQTFREVVQKPGQSIVRVQCDGEDVCLGIIVGANGWILTKAHDLKGKITCQLKDGQEFAAKLVGVHEGHDLAMLKIRAGGLPPIAWHHSDNLRAGSWVASAGMSEDPAAVGVVSVPTRKIHDAYLGVLVEVAPQGLRVLNIVTNSAASKAGLRPKDVILRVDGQSFTDSEAFGQCLAGHKPGDTITLLVRRDQADAEFKAKLQSREPGGDFRAEFQNRLGSELSTRRSGYSVILQHDSVIKPGDCGGPLVDLQGRVVGINISRAGRVESWAIPAEIAQELIADLKSGRLAQEK